MDVNLSTFAIVTFVNPRFIAFNDVIPFALVIVNSFAVPDIAKLVT